MWEITGVRENSPLSFYWSIIALKHRVNILTISIVKYIPSLSSLPPTLASHPLGHHRAPAKLSVLHSSFPPAICFTHGSVYVSMLCVSPFNFSLSNPASTSLCSLLSEVQVWLGSYLINSLLIWVLKIKLNFIVSMAVRRCWTLHCKSASLSFLSFTLSHLSDHIQTRACSPLPLQGRYTAWNTLLLLTLGRLAFFSAFSASLIFQTHSHIII